MKKFKASSLEMESKVCWCQDAPTGWLTVLQQFQQHIASQAIDALYEAFDLESPRVTVVVDMAYPSTKWTAE